MRAVDIESGYLSRYMTISSRMTQSLAQLTDWDSSLLSIATTIVICGRTPLVIDCHISVVINIGDCHEVFATGTIGWASTRVRGKRLLSGINCDHAGQLAFFLQILQSV